MSNKIQPHYYMNIPAYVWNDKDLLRKPKAILLYGHIATLANTKGYCWATNEYFAKQLKVDKRTIIDYVNLLVNKKYIKRKVFHKENSKEVDERLLSIFTTPSDVDFTRPGDDNFTTPSDVDFTTPSDVDFTENNTSNNNTSNNNTTTTEQPNKPKNAFEKYQIYVGMLNAIQTPVLIDYVQRLGDEVVSYAIDNMLDYTNKPNFNYLRKILSKYEQLGIDSVEKAKELDEKHSKKQEEIHQARNNRYGRKPRQEKMPYWYHEKDNSEKTRENKSKNTETKSEIARLMQKINKEE